MIHSLVFSSFLISSAHFMEDKSTEDPGFSIKMNKFYLWNANRNMHISQYISQQTLLSPDIHVKNNFKSSLLLFKI